MLFTMTFLVLLTAIMAMFSTEFNEILKRIFKLPGVLLFAPLLVASFLAFFYEEVIWYLLNILREGFQFLVAKIVTLAPNILGMSILTKVFLLTIIAFIPIYISQFLSARYVISGGKKIMARIAIFCWSAIAVIFVTIKM